MSLIHLEEENIRKILEDKNIEIDMIVTGMKQVTVITKNELSDTEKNTVIEELRKIYPTLREREPPENMVNLYNKRMRERG